jgi:hypothetical protein
MPQGPQGHSPPSNMNPVSATGQYQHRLSASSAVDGSGMFNRSSLPPGIRLGTQQHNPSPLARNLTPPPADYLRSGTEPFPSVENLESGGSGSNFHISGSALPSNSVSSNDQTSPLVRHHHSTGSSFGSKADTLESQLHTQHAATRLLTVVSSILRFMYPAVASERGICLYRMHIGTMSRLRRRYH